ncbi:MAG TPA: sigma-70 family RNA polymerase sigma factor [Kofleriaceae bacterium]|jgi:RNA polymerase sigma-70 factor (ECF subfamily)
MTSAAIGSAIRACYSRVLAKTFGMTRNLAEAEDAVHDAIERALETWVAMFPENPEAWLVAVARNRVLDRQRHLGHRDRHRDAIEALAAMSPWVRLALGDPSIGRGWKDELLALIFACCDPALDDGEAAALALATVIGMSTSEVASAFVVSPRTMEQRLTRARQRLRQHGVVRGPSVERLDAVLRTLHLLFNEGYSASTGEAPIRAELCRLAMGLASSVREALADPPEVVGLASLFALHDARRGARLDASGAPVPLPEQDRALWDRAAIRLATGDLERALATGRLGPFQLEAAISAVHCRAERAADTDWPEIAELYALLEPMRRSPAVRVNRAYAVGRAHGADAGLALLALGDLPHVDAYPYVDLVRGALLEEAGRIDEAVVALQRAAVRARSHEVGQVRARIARLVQGSR